MTHHVPFALPASFGLALFLAACGPTTSSPEGTRALPLAVAGQPAKVSTAAQHPAPQQPRLEAPPQRAATRPAAGAKPPRRSRPEAAFGGSRDDVQTLIGHYRSVQLSPEQERIKAEALSELPAPCCSQYSLATCCCPCNMAKAAWGMAAWLISEHGYGAEQVRDAAKDWLQRVNPEGFSGNACMSGGCGRPMHQDGCAGMQEETIVF